MGMPFISQVRGRLEQYQETATKLAAALPAADIIIAGGACRDLLHGIEPRDVDLLWLGDGPIALGEQLEEAVDSYVAKISSVLPEATDITVHETYRGQKASLEFVIGFSYRGVTYDLICYGYCQTPREQVLQFDTNLNMMWVTVDEDGCPAIVVEAEAAAVITHRDPITIVNETGQKAAERLAYMQEKFPQYKEVK